MRTMEKLSVTVTQAQAKYIEQQVASGEYASDSEVIREGLRALAARDKAQERWLEKTVAATYDRVMAGHGHFRTIDEVRDLITNQIQAKR